MEPIAIVGIGCRFPGAKDPNAFWQLLRDGVDAIREVPPDRWDVNALYSPDRGDPGKMNTRWGGFIDQVDLFDNEFFGISSREADMMDPQQRLLLEVAWEALEDAGLAPDSLARCDAGVFVGIMNPDYGQLQMSNLNAIDGYTGTGSAMSIAANRLSYVFDFRGPSIAIDTACSSSLVALHLACQSLWRCESRPIALAGGVNLLLSPAGTVFFSKAGVMAPDGRSKTFDADSIGFVRGEGAGIVVLKPLSDARSDGDSIYAVIRGCAINQDGRSNGLMSPNRFSQEAVLKEAYRQAGVTPSQIQYVEAHGTGTAIGDPIEAMALGTVFAADRPPQNACYIGSVKPNIGHLESAAGIAGLIKVALMLKHRLIPPNLHYRQPNPHIPFERLPLRVPQRLESWPNLQPAIAGVSSFGFGGTNAHVVMEEAPKQTDLSAGVERPLHLFALSAQSENVLKSLAGRFEDYLKTAAVESISDLCFTANAGRSHFRHRMTATAGSAAQLLQCLTAFGSGHASEGLLSGYTEARKSPKVVFLFTGQGSQYLGMGQHLLANQPVFRRQLQLCEEILRPHLDRPLLEYLYSFNKESDSSLNDTRLTQPALFAIEYALAQMWMSWGIAPSAMVGHSVGEYVAACLAGMFTLEEGLSIVAARGQLMSDLPRNGMMAAVMASESMIAARIAQYGSDITIAAYNSPNSLVLSGKTRVLEEVLTTFTEENIPWSRLNVSHAFHSPLMEPMLNDFEAVLKRVNFRPPQIPIVSNLTGEILTTGQCAPAYWLRHTCAPVRFYQSIQYLSNQNCRTFIEVGPRPILSGLVRQILQGLESVLLVPSMGAGPRRSEFDDWGDLLQGLAQLYLQGVVVDWRGFDRPYHRRRLHLPTYPFERKRCWFESPSEDALSVSGRNRRSQSGSWRGSGSSASSNSLIHSIFHKRLSVSSDITLREHVVKDAHVLPASVYLDLAVTGARRFLEQPSCQLSNVVLSRPFQIEPSAEKEVHVLVDSPPDSIGSVGFRIVSTDANDGVLEHVSGEIVLGTPQQVPRQIDLVSSRAGCQNRLPPNELYLLFRKHGLSYGPFYQSIAFLEWGDREVLAHLRLPPSAARYDGWGSLHPSLIDGALQVLGSLVLVSAIEREQMSIYVPFVIGKLQIFDELPCDLLCHAVLSDGESAVGDSPETLHGHVRLLDHDGTVLVALDDVCLVRLPKPTIKAEVQQISPERPGALEREPADRVNLNSWFNAIQWRPLPLKEGGTHRVGIWLVLMDDAGVGQAVSDGLALSGDQCLLVRQGRRYERLGHREYAVNPKEPADYQSLIDILIEEDVAPTGVIHLWACVGSGKSAGSLEDLSSSQDTGIYSLLYLTQALTRRVLHQVSYWLVTSYAQPVGGLDSKFIAPERATLWGLGRVLPKEYHNVICSGIDLETEGWLPSDLAQLIMREIDGAGANSTEGAWLAYRSGTRFTRELVCVEPLTQDHRELPFRDGGVYLITGGHTGIGLEIARYIATKVRSKVALVNRSPVHEGLYPHMAEAITGLKQLGAEVLSFVGDVSDIDSMQRLLNEIQTVWGRLDGIIHCAGVLADGLVVNLTREEFEKVLRPKVMGTWVLDWITRNCVLDFFVICSSLTSIIAPAGQSNYVAANCFVDAFAHYRAASRGQRTLAINWGLWRETGAVSSPRYQTALAAAGIRAMTNAEGIAGFERALKSDLVQLAVFPPQDSRPAVYESIYGINDSALVSELDNHPVELHGCQLSSIVNQVEAHEAKLHALYGLDRYSQLGVQLNTLSLSYWNQALKKLGWNPSVHDRLSATSLMKQLGIQHQRLSLVAGLLNTFLRHGIVETRGSEFELCQIADLEDPVAQAESILAQYPACDAELTLVMRCGAHLSELLQGKCDSLELLFPEGSVAILESLYQDSPFCRFYNGLVQHAISAAVEQLGQGRKVRILEVGAGTGGTTSYIIPKLRPETVEFVFTDVSAHLINHARNKFHQFTGVRYERLDIEQDPLAQGFMPHQFDIIVAANVLHATADMRETLGFVRQLMASEGLLIVLEGMQPQAWLDLVFGLTDGWWKFVDRDLRPDHPLMSRARWRTVLERVGFTEVSYLPRSSFLDTTSGQALILTQNPAISSPGSVLKKDRLLERGGPSPGAVQLRSHNEVPTDQDPLLRKVRQKVVSRISQSLRVELAEFSLGRNFRDLGLDSLMAVEITGLLQKDLGIRLTPTMFFQFPTIEEFAERLVFADRHELEKRFELEESDQGLFRPPAATPVVVSTVKTDLTDLSLSKSSTPSTPQIRIADLRAGSALPLTDGIAVIGLACRFPGAHNLRAFWELLVNGVDAIREVPASRWEWRNYVENRESEGRDCSRWGGFIDAIDQFDPLFFNISPREARLMDPQQRLFLEVAWETLEHAGYAGECMVQTNTGVFVGSTNSSYYERIASHLTPLDHSAGIGNMNAIIPNRVSYQFDLRGPSVLVDTLCSASLVALDLACQSLTRGDCTMAIVGGVNLLLSAEYYVGLRRMNVHAPDGRCKAFDHRANGFASGEGAGAVLLKPLHQALVDGDRIHAVIKGSAVNHDGRSNGLTAPNPRAQAELLCRAYKAAGVSMDSVSYIEAHGTGTLLGDPIEIEGLSQAFVQHTKRKQFCAIGSVKTNIGHLEPAAGIAGLIKVILSLQNRQLPASLHFEKANPLIAFENTPFKVNTELRAWNSNGARFAGVSSFGMGGTNAHVVLMEAPYEIPTVQPRRSAYMLPLSARSEAALNALIRRYQQYLDEHPDVSLTDLCYTAGIGRGGFKYRLAIIADSLQGFVDNLAIVATTSKADLAHLSIFYGVVDPEIQSDVMSSSFDDERSSDEWLARLLVVCRGYVKGESVQWTQLYAQEAPRRIPLPDYPFERERCWVEMTKTHPLLGKRLNP